VSSLKVALGVVLAVSSTAVADVHLMRRANGSTVIFNDDVGSGWRVHGRIPSDAYLVARRDARTPFDETIARYARERGVDPLLAKCVMLIESNYNPRAISRKGARGLMQLMPATASRYGVSDSFNADENIRAGIRHLGDLLEQWGGSVTHALAAYNAGSGAVAKYSGVPPYPETQEYIRRALVAYGGSTQLPVIGGGFKGQPVGSTYRVASSEPVKLQRGDSGPLLTNAGPVRREAPVLGRVVATP